MVENMMVYFVFWYLFEVKFVYVEGGMIVLYGGKVVLFIEIGSGELLLIDLVDLMCVNGFELKFEGVCCGDLCILFLDGMLIE